MDWVRKIRIWKGLVKTWRMCINGYVWRKKEIEETYFGNSTRGNITFSCEYSSSAFIPGSQVTGQRPNYVIHLCYSSALPTLTTMGVMKIISNILVDNGEKQNLCFRVILIGDSLYYKGRHIVLLLWVDSVETGPLNSRITKWSSHEATTGDYARMEQVKSFKWMKAQMRRIKESSV